MAKTQNTHHCLGPNGEEYVVRRIKLDSPGPNGEWWKLWIVVSNDDGENWTELPMKKTLWSCIAAMNTDWPPERVDKFEFIDGRLFFEYRDEWHPYVRYSNASMWRAEYLPNRRVWRLKRVRYMDYENQDKPPIG